MENENVVENNSNSQEEEVLETSNEEQIEQQEGEDINEYKARLYKAEQLANNYKIRAEKAERLAKSIKTEQPKANEQSDNLSVRDIYTLMDAKVPEIDIEVVQKFAKLEGISIAEAVKNPLVKTILADRAEQRKTASVANTTASKRGSGKVSDEALLEKALKTGELPDNEEDLQRLWRARKGLK